MIRCVLALWSCTFIARAGNEKCFNSKTGMIYTMQAGRAVDSLNVGERLRILKCLPNSEQRSKEVEHLFYIVHYHSCDKN